MATNKYVLLTENNVVLAEAVLVFSNGKNMVFRVSSAKSMSRLSGYNCLRYHKMESYAETFEGQVYDLKMDKIYLQEIKNISATMRSELKVKVKYDSIIRSVEDSSVINQSIHAKDISCGGMCFTCSQDLSTSIVYETIVPITSDPVIVGFEIIRKSQDEDTGEFIYGCRFRGMNNREEIMLRQAVYKLQMILYKKTKKRREMGEI